MLPLSAIHETVEELCKQLEDLVEQITEAGQQAAEAESAFKATFAQSRLMARARANEDGKRITVDEVDDMATETTQQLRLEHLLKANNLLVLREAMRARQAQLDGFRTLAASYRGAGG